MNWILKKRNEYEVAFYNEDAWSLPCKVLDQDFTVYNCLLSTKALVLQTLRMFCYESFDYLSCNSTLT